MSIAAAVTRGVVGGVAGSVVCLFLVLVLCEAVDYHPPSHETVLLVTLPSIAVGVVAGAVFGVLAGTWEIRGIAKVVALGAAAGCLLGLLAAVVHSRIVAGQHEKAEAVIRSAEIVVGVPAGGILGGVAGLPAGVFRRRDVTRENAGRPLP